MPQIFVFPAGNEDAQRNLEISIKRPVPVKTVFDAKSGSDQQLKWLESIRQEGNGFYVWGAQPSDDHGNEHTWQAMEPGDYVLAYYRRAYHYVARVLGKYYEPELARAIWDEDADGNTWEYMYFLTEPVKIDAPTSWVADSLNLSNKEYRRFCRIDPKKKMPTILSTHGSVQNFIDRLLERQEKVGTANPFAPVTESETSLLEVREDLERTEVDREIDTIRERLASPPALKEGLGAKTVQISARPRSAAFAISVKRLYGYRCAICGSNLRAPNGAPEVQSAHIYPKKFDGRDDARNGICLCRRHHWAFDYGWISIADDYTVMVREGLPNHDNYQFIGEYEGERIRLPSVEESAPDTIYLREHRRLMGFE